MNGCQSTTALVHDLVGNMESMNDRVTAPRFSKRWFGNLLVGFVVLVLLPAAYYGLAQYKFNGSYSVFDEVSHMSYAWSVSHGNLPAKGDNVAQQVLDDWPCSGQDRSTIASCKDGKATSQFTVVQQYNYFHPPVYYFITGWFARIVSTIWTGISFMVAARALSIVWMVAGCIALYFALRSWKIEKIYCYATVALIPFIPVFLNPGTAVTNDAPGLLAGASTIWVSSMILLRQKKFLWPAVGLAFIFGLVKGTFVFQFLGLAAVLVLYGVWSLFRNTDDRQRGKDLLIQGMAIGISGLVSLYSFTIFQSFRGDQSAKSVIQGINTNPIVGSPLGELINTSMNWVLLADDGTLRGGMSDSVGYVPWIALLNVVILGAVGYVFFQQNSPKAYTVFAYVTALSLVLYPLIINFRQFLAANDFLPSVGERYGISILPLVLCCWALALHQRRARAVAVVIPVLGAAVCFACLVMMPVFTIPS
jgi:hypothetical protein